MARKQLQLKQLLTDLNVTQVSFARDLGVSAPTMSQLLVHGIFPKKTPTRNIIERATAFLLKHGATSEQCEDAFKAREWTPERSNARRPDAPNSHSENEDDIMLLRKQALTPNARQRFGLVRDPFAEISDSAQVYANDAIRYARASMLDKAKHGGFMAVVGESGAGKSTLRRDLIERINRDGLPVRVIQPYILAMGDSERKGTPLKALNIVEAILADIAPLERLRQTHEARFRQVHAALRESFRSGNRHVLIIEEAHAMPIPTLKALKRFVELEEGFQRLLSIILIGQTELALKLSEQNAEVREVVQRCEIVTLPPILNLGDYLQFKFKAVDVPLAKVIDDSGIQAITDRLQPPTPRGHPQRSLLYPLAIHNILAAAMNLAAENGAPLVTADIVQEV